MEKSLLAVSELALQRMSEFKRKDDREDVGWRLSLVRTHCMRGRGYSYKVALEKLAENDSRLVQEGETKVYATESDVSRLNGSELDYVETLQSSGFVVKNPNARSKCPCGRHDIFD